MDSFPLYTKYVSMKHDVKLRARPIVKRIEDPEEIEELFDPVTYQKVRWEKRLPFVENENSCKKK